MVKCRPENLLSRNREKEHTKLLKKTAEFTRQFHRNVEEVIAVLEDLKANKVPGLKKIKILL